jgi:hypothetical protein
MAFSVFGGIRRAVSVWPTLRNNERGNFDSNQDIPMPVPAAPPVCPHVPGHYTAGSPDEAFLCFKTDS